MHDSKSHCEKCTGSGCPDLSEKKIRTRYSYRAYTAVRGSVNSLIQKMIAFGETREWGREELSKIRQGADWQSLPISYHAEFEGHYSGALMAIYAGLVSWCHRDPSTDRFISAKGYWEDRKTKDLTAAEATTSYHWLKDQNNSAFVWTATLNASEQRLF